MFDVTTSPRKSMCTTRLAIEFVFASFDR
jgi:hypothetical protein